MNVSRGDAARGLVAAIVLGFLAFVLLVQYAPDAVAFSPNNYGWNGLEGVASTYGVNFTTTLPSVPPKSVLVITQPSITYSESDASTIRGFLQGGGTVLVADKSGVANSLLEGLGSAITIESQFSISDRTYNWKSSSVPTALVLPGAKSRFGFLANVSGIALTQPSPLQVSDGVVSDLATTSQFSVSTNNTAGMAGTRGPFTVMAAQRFGNGTLIVVGDSQFLLNSEWTLANNRALIGNLFANRGVFIDASHWGASSTAQLKSELGQLYTLISGVPLRYITVLFVVGLALALVPGGEKKRSDAPTGLSRLTPFNATRRGLGE
jgi:Domain of unknown function (DUF4350)